MTLLDYALPLSVAITLAIALLACSDKLKLTVWFRLLLLVIVILPFIYFFLVNLSDTLDPATLGSVVDNNSQVLGDPETEGYNTGVFQDTKTPKEEGEPWYKDFRFWGCVLFAGLVLAAFYFRGGFAPISPEDLDRFNTTVSTGIEHITSEQASLNQALENQVNISAERLS